MIGPTQQERDVDVEIWRDDGYKVKHRLKPGLRVLDIGANRGGFTTRVAEAGCFVLAVEPHLPSYERLVERTAGLQVRTMHAALGPQNGVCSILERGLGGQISSWDDGDVPQHRIESFGDGWDICKIDVEGAEYAALTNADLTGLKYIAIEFHVTREIGSPFEMGLGENALPFAPGSVQQLCYWMHRTHTVQLVGHVGGGGYILGERR